MGNMYQTLTVGKMYYVYFFGHGRVMQSFSEKKSGHAQILTPMH